VKSQTRERITVLYNVLSNICSKKMYIRENTSKGILTEVCTCTLKRALFIIVIYVVIRRFISISFKEAFTYLKEYAFMNRLINTRKLGQTLALPKETN